MIKYNGIKNFLGTAILRDDYNGNEQEIALAYEDNRLLAVHDNGYFTLSRMADANQSVVDFIKTFKPVTITLK